MNAYGSLAAFNRQAQKAGWPKDKIEKVLRDARSADYEHLNEVLLQALSKLEASAHTQ